MAASDLIAVLGLLSVGSHVAADEVDTLSSYFVETDQFERLKQRGLPGAVERTVKTVGNNATIRRQQQVPEVRPSVLTARSLTHGHPAGRRGWRLLDAAPGRPSRIPYSLRHPLVMATGPLLSTAHSLRTAPGSNDGVLWLRPKAAYEKRSQKPPMTVQAMSPATLPTP